MTYLICTLVSQKVVKLEGQHYSHATNIFSFYPDYDLEQVSDSLRLGSHLGVFSMRVFALRLCIFCAFMFIETSFTLAFEITRNKSVPVCM